MTKYLVIQNIRDSAEFEGSREQFVSWAQARGLELDDPAYETAAHLLPVLRGEPKFKGFWGPGSNGNPVRYEDWESNRFYST